MSKDPNKVKYVISVKYKYKDKQQDAYIIYYEELDEIKRQLFDNDLPTKYYHFNITNGQVFVDKKSVLGITWWKQ